MPQHIDENGKLRMEIFTISPDYQLLDKQEKMEVLLLIKQWLDMEVIKIQFEKD
jgi:hypothetical protein